METAHRRNAAMAMSSLPKFAGGGLIEGFKTAIGITPESPELKAYKERAAAERSAKKPSLGPAQPITQAEKPSYPVPKAMNYMGNPALKERMSAADAMAAGGPIKGPGTGTSDEVPILASNGEYVIRAAAVEEVGTDVLDAINALGEDKSDDDDPEDKQPGKYAVGGLIQDESKKPMDATAVADRQMASNAFNTMKDVSETAGRAIADVATVVPRGVVGAYDSAVVRPMRALGMNASYLSPALTPDGASVDSPTPFSDIKRARTAQQAMAAPTVPTMPSSLALPVSAAGAGRGMVNPASAAPAQGVPIDTLAVTAPQAAPRNSFGDAASWNSNRTPMSAQDQMAMDGIQARQDMRDSNAVKRAQYDSEVASANATNTYTANRGKSTARLGMEGKLAQDVRGDATARYQTDVNAGTSRYNTDMQRENNRGQLGVSQGRLANETASTGVEIAGKQQTLDAQRALTEAKTPEEVESATQILRALQGKYGKDQTTHWKGIAGGTDAMGNKTDPFLYNEATGETKRASGEQPGGKPQVTRAQVDAAAKAKGISDPAQLKKMYAVYGV